MPTDDAPALPRRRIRLSLRGLLLVVLIAGVGLGLYARKLDREARVWAASLALAQQFNTTQSTIMGPIRALFGGAPITRADLHGSSSGVGWSHTARVETTDPGGQSRLLLSLAFQGGLDGIDLAPVVIEDLGGEHHAEALAILLREYQKRGWAYRVVDSVARARSDASAP